MKLAENSAEYATYEYLKPVYEPDPERPKRQRICSYLIGSARVHKLTGTVEQLTGKEWDTEGFYFVRVARVMGRHFKDGHYPENTGYQA